MGIEGICKWIRDICNSVSITDISNSFTDTCNSIADIFKCRQLQISLIHLKISAIVFQTSLNELAISSIELVPITDICHWFADICKFITDICYLFRDISNSIADICNSIKS